MNDLGNRILQTYFDNPSIKWALVAFGIFLLLFSLYKMSVTHTRARNGRVDTRFRMPLKVPIKKLKPNLRVPKITRTPSQREKLVLFSLINLLLITLGSLLFLVGLGLCTLAFQWSPEKPTAVGRIWPVAMFFIGLGFTAGGFFTAYWRHKNNPYNPAHQV